jgi:hypothetical protein
VKWSSAEVKPVVSKTDQHRAVLAVGTLRLIMDRAEVLWLANALADIAGQLAAPTPGPQEQG